MASPRRSWSLSLLPPEIIQEIFYKTPAEALVLSKPTCKKLYTLITDHSFIYKHFQRTQEHFIRASDTVQIMDPITRKISVSPVPNELLRHPFKIDTLVNTHMVHCDGFMLVAYDEPEVEIYECKTSSWRTLDVELDVGVIIMLNCVAVMGNMYWVAYRDEEVETEFIWSFDFSDESFKEICFCPPSYDISHLASLNGDSLSLLKQDEVSRTIEVWVSSKLGDGDGDVSFSKYFSLSGPDIPALRIDDEAARPVYCFVKTKSVIVWCVGVEGEGDKVCRCLTLYEIDEDGVRNDKVTERDYVHDYSRSNLCGYVYVPSMIPLPWVGE
ncbi:unnamed protein product [Eruca vesicaria subsp. sativa]|uniref:F-box domain-containing protein n=1 Tax=Eruca vesicaria subsp. sativa TaxID=29727 RepID=A0ABC8IMZ7_ERUVS|nr:unnamed protein product [Eruca vesicaria subsp. sativa]